MQAIDESFRESSEYREWMEAIIKHKPNIPKYLAECAIMCHLADKQAYKGLKNAPMPFVKPFESTEIKGVKILPPEEINNDSNLECASGPLAGSPQDSGDAEERN